MPFLLLWGLYIAWASHSFLCNQSITHSYPESQDFPISYPNLQDDTSTQPKRDNSAYSDSAYNSMHDNSYCYDNHHTDSSSNPPHRSVARKPYQRRPLLASVLNTRASAPDTYVLYYSLLLLHDDKRQASGFMDAGEDIAVTCAWMYICLSITPSRASQAWLETWQSGPPRNILNSLP